MMQGNLEINNKEGFVSVSINPKIYSLDVIYSAAYMFIDNCYILVDGDPQIEIIVELRPKKKGTNLETLGREFNTELVSYTTYAINCAKNAGLRDAILRRVLFTNDVDLQNQSNLPNEGKGCVQDERKPLIDDPEEIAVPWEEKYAKGNDKQRKQ